MTTARALLPAFLLSLTWLLQPGCSLTEREQAGAGLSVDSSAVHIRLNLVGYLPEDPKVAVVFSHRPVYADLAVIDAGTEETVYKASPAPSDAPGWGSFAHYYTFDFTPVAEEGTYYLEVTDTDNEEQSPRFTIGEGAYGDYHEALLTFMRQQRCGYNPFLDVVCHKKDGRTFFGLCRIPAISTPAEDGTMPATS